MIIMIAEGLKKYKKPLLFFCALGLILVLNVLFGWTDFFSDKENLALLKNTLNDNLPIAIVIYIVVTAVGCGLLALPGTIFVMGAGFLFGPLLGMLAASFATAAGAALAFLVGRYFLRDAIQPLAMRNPYVKKIFLAADGKNDIFLLMVTRIVPVFPYCLQNFAYGITNIKFLTYILYSWLFMLPMLCAFTLIAAGINDTKSRVLCLSAALVLLILVATISLAVRKKSAILCKTKEMRQL
ncbi:MAG: VTT domain-containing protein [Termitinemataceae bacterium]|nr:MAG: VTT domain-containing protein [Termitinemataceae bacterium]